MSKLIFILNSVLLGAGLAMDAFSVSIADGLREPEMSRRRMAGIAGTYAGFQCAMPLIGWICVRTIASYFSLFHRMIPWIALFLLVYIGGKMILEAVREQRSGEKERAETPEKLDFFTLMLQGTATSIDALSVGFAISEYNALSALVSSLIIAAVTFWICMAGLVFGRKAGGKLSDKAAIVGGVILIGIGLEIFIKGLL